MLGGTSMIGQVSAYLTVLSSSLRSSCHAVSTHKQHGGQVSREGEETLEEDPLATSKPQRPIAWLPS